MPPADAVTLSAAEYAALRAKADAAGLLALGIVTLLALTAGTVPAAMTPEMHHRFAGGLVGLAGEVPPSEATRRAAVALLDAFVAHLTAEPAEVLYAGC